jgi:hypothetical protein
MPNYDRPIAFADFERYVLSENDIPGQDQSEIVEDLKKVREIVGKDEAVENEWYAAWHKVVGN